MPHYCTLIPGDGIGPEVAHAAVRAVEATGVDICWNRAELNEAIILESGKTLPQYLLDSLNETRVGLKGPVTTPVAGGFQSVNVALRKGLRPIRKCTACPHAAGHSNAFSGRADQHGDLP